MQGSEGGSVIQCREADIQKEWLGIYMKNPRNSIKWTTIKVSMTSLLYYMNELKKGFARLHHPVIGFLFKGKVSQDEYFSLKERHEQKTRVYLFCM
jgi:hypothetical protein